MHPFISCKCSSSRVLRTAALELIRAGAGHRNGRERVEFIPGLICETLDRVRNLLLLAVVYIAAH